MAGYARRINSPDHRSAARIRRAGGPISRPHSFFDRCQSNTGFGQLPAAGLPGPQDQLGRWLRPCAVLARPRRAALRRPGDGGGRVDLSLPFAGGITNRRRHFLLSSGRHGMLIFFLGRRGLELAGINLGHIGYVSRRYPATIVLCNGDHLPRVHGMSATGSAVMTVCPDCSGPDLAKAPRRN